MACIPLLRALQTLVIKPSGLWLTTTINEVSNRPSRRPFSSSPLLAFAYLIREVRTKALVACLGGIILSRLVETASSLPAWRPDATRIMHLVNLRHHLLGYGISSRTGDRGLSLVCSTGGSRVGHSPSKLDKPSPSQGQRPRLPASFRSSLVRETPHHRRDTIAKRQKADLKIPDQITVAKVGLVLI